MFSTLRTSLLGPTLGEDDAQLSLFMAKIAFIYTVLCILFLSVKPAPYGRFANSMPRFMDRFQVEVRFAWLVQEVPAFIIPVLLVWEEYQRLNAAQLIILGTLCLHYFQRSFIFPFLLTPGKLTPILPFIGAILFCSFNGFFQAITVANVTVYGPEDHLKPAFITGLVLFLVGFGINVDSDRRLRNLRGKGQKSGYKIPRGGCFELVSAANYFGEILEWLGYAMMASNISGIFFGLWSLLFLSLRGVQYHRFYVEKFKEDYPKKRKAVIPFLL